MEEEKVRCKYSEMGIVWLEYELMFHARRSDWNAEGI